MLRAHLTRNWSSVGTVSAHGNAFLHGRCFGGESLARYFDSSNARDFVSTLASANGFFAVLQSVGEDEWVVAVDRVRSIPLFYGKRGRDILVSDDADWLRRQVGDTKMDAVAREEFQLAGYVTGPDTLFPNVKQLQAGELLRVHQPEGAEPTVTAERWYRFTHQEVKQWDEAALRHELNAVAEESVQRLVEYANGRQIVIPLSGGYDSRLIALLLKRVGYNNILTFTYGVPGNKESEYSRQLAEALGLPWHFVEYSADKWRSAWQTEERLDYQRWSSGWASLPHAQDWLAVRELKRTSTVPENCVFVPGHGAMAILSHLKALPANADLSQVAPALVRSKFDLAPLSRSQRVILLERTGNLLEIPREHAPDPCSLFSYFEWQERQSKFLVNAVRVYEFYGYDWWLPLWDAEFMAFWRKVPLNLRIGKGWYIEYVKDHWMRCADSRKRSIAGNAAARPKGLSALRDLIVRTGGPIESLARDINRRRSIRGHMLNPFWRFPEKPVNYLLKDSFSLNGIEAFFFIDFAESCIAGTCSSVMNELETL